MSSFASAFTHVFDSTCPASIKWLCSRSDDHGSPSLSTPSAALSSHFFWSFFGSAALFWWALVHGRFRRQGYGAAVVWVFTTSLHSGVLGALLTFAPRLWYPIYEERTGRFGLSALEDQQLAGLLMWVPAGFVFLLLGLALFAAWLGESERRVARTRSELLLRGGTGHGG